MSEELQKLEEDFKQFADKAVRDLKEDAKRLRAMHVRYARTQRKNVEETVFHDAQLHAEREAAKGETP